jgi:hypothetical protein
MSIEKGLIKPLETFEDGSSDNESAPDEVADFSRSLNFLNFSCRELMRGNFSIVSCG